MKKQSPPKPHKLPKAIYILSSLQVISFFFMLFVIYETNHDDNPSDYEWMGAIAPGAAFFLFGVINILLVGIHIIVSLKNKSPINKKVLGVAVLLLLLYVCSQSIVEYVNNL